jgi:hypothetical protein
VYTVERRTPGGKPLPAGSEELWVASSLAVDIIEAMPSFRRVQWTGRAGLQVGSPLSFIVYLGLLLVLGGAGVDTGYHVWWSGESRFAAVGLVGHLVTLAGMVVTMVGVFAVGLRRPSPARCVKGEFDAASRSSASTS